MKNKELEFIKIYEDFNLNNQYWKFKLKSGEWVECGFGLIKDEFALETDYQFGLLNEDIVDKLHMLRTINGFYTIDQGSDEEVLEMYEPHPDDDSFVLIPKEDIIETCFEIIDLNIIPKLIQIK